MNIEDYRKSKKNANKPIENKFIKSLLIKTMVSLVLFLSFLIGIKKIEGFDKFIYENIYVKNMSFAKFNSWYEKHFGNLIPIKRIDEVQVFDEKIDYLSKEQYLDGVKLKLEEGYVIPFINSGIVVYIGEKNNYGKTIIVQDENGLETWYSNVNISNINLYDYVKKGDYLGEAIDNNLILIFYKNGKKESYQNYV